MSPTPSERIRLTGTPIGRKVRVADFGSEIDPLQVEQLHAYGMSPPHLIRVTQQQPMTVVLCDHMELALEHEVARHVWVEEA
ncbi:ferrous iron transport protein A [Azoarcus sp. L1K30]|uniref:ferrous iron transport protein A n=1 Tax=Azoarcus sp. L1K30 TaxID=2820277 RepID=UPI001B820857|nr:ferrous iron transport protein A [Azoarcus sp. L1K30]MBR0566723.1 ferrous iron transport protein A [Azoarcus sp. L1K30]